MGLLSNLLGYVPPEQEPELQSIFSAVAEAKIRSGKLPTIIANGVLLEAGEICHFVDVAAEITEKKRRQTTYSGSSIRIVKGYTAHLGQSQSVPVSEPHYTKGILYMTNQRIIFVARENAFDKKIKALTAITPYTNGVVFQFGSKAYTLLLPNAPLVTDTLNMIV